MLALIEEEDEQRFVIGEIDTFSRGQASDSMPITRLKSFTVLNYDPKSAQVIFSLIEITKMFYF